MDQAVNVCVLAAKTDSSSRAAIVLALSLIKGRPTEQEFRVAEPVLAKALAEHASDRMLVAVIGNVRVVQGNIEEAARLYRRAIKMQSNDVMAIYCSSSTQTSNTFSRSTWTCLCFHLKSIPIQ